MRHSSNPLTALRTALLKSVAVAAMAFTTFTGTEAHAEKVRDLANIAGARDNQLVGYGIVTGLSGTGDDVSVPFAAQSTLSLVRRLGVQVDAKQLRLKNVAAVAVTATIPPFAKAGTRLDVQISSIGNAKSLIGGILVQSVLKGADQKAYAVAQGAVLLGGFDARGNSGSTVKSGVTTAGRIPEGAIIENEIATNFVQNGRLRLDLRTPGFAVSAGIADALNAKFGLGTANAEDGGAVMVKIPESFAGRPVQLISALEDTEVQFARKARVIINERTGTIVAGGDVRLSPAVVVNGSLTIVVRETPTVSQPTAPVFGSTNGKTVVVARSEVEVTEGSKTVALVPKTATLAEVSSAIAALGLPPRELASVLQGLRSAGALEAEIVVQ